MSGKRAGTGLVIVGAVVVVVYFRFLRPWHLHWGATAQRGASDKMHQFAGAIPGR
jgi:hypothetical protein